ncbi:hypothetical protein M5K25_014826 [Dendrobium thyrsiflorum]|uniref:Uncharacterized protein n=1 Tax=Dendrobium thyrsiflorum TaxID=117978 RepID=A0ABD0UNU4_DENTH
MSIYIGSVSVPLADQDYHSSVGCYVHFILGHMWPTSGIPGSNTAYLTQPYLWAPSLDRDLHLDPANDSYLGLGLGYRSCSRSSFPLPSPAHAPCSTVSIESFPVSRVKRNLFGFLANIRVRTAGGFLWTAWGSFSNGFQWEKMVRFDGQKIDLLGQLFLISWKVEERFCQVIGINSNEKAVPDFLVGGNPNLGVEKLRRRAGTAEKLFLDWFSDGSMEKTSLAKLLGRWRRGSGRLLELIPMKKENLRKMPQNRKFCISTEVTHCLKRPSTVIWSIVAPLNSGKYKINSAPSSRASQRHGGTAAPNRQQHRDEEFRAVD